MIKVSVIVPVFNVSKYLSECLDSILNQTLEDIEIICGDGGSTDGSLVILEEYKKKDKRIKVISKNGSGYGESVNDCFDMATGEYISIVESDDVIKSDMYEILYNKAKRNDLDFIKSDIYFYHPNSKKKLSKESVTYKGLYYNKVLNPENDIRPYKTTLHTWAGLYKRSFLSDNKIRHNETPGGSFQDVGFYLKTLFYAKRVMFIRKPFYMWRQDNPCSSIHYDALKLIDKSKNEWDLDKKYLEKVHATDMMWYSFNYRRYFSFLWTIEMGKDKATKFKKYAVKELRNAYLNKKVSKEFFTKKQWNEFIKFIELD